MLFQLLVDQRMAAKSTITMGLMLRPHGRGTSGFFLCFAPPWVFPNAPKSDKHQDKTAVKKTNSLEEEATVLPEFAPPPGNSKTQ